MKIITILLLALFSITGIYAVYYHPFQNFDDDVDRIKTYSNFFGGDHGIMNSDSLNSLIFAEYDTADTRTGFGRSLKINYDSLSVGNWSSYVESFTRQWYTMETSFDLTNLFPDYQAAEFQNRDIDSLVFYCKLNASNPLTLTIEFHDKFDSDVEHHMSFTRRTVYPSTEWQRVSINLNNLGSFKVSL